MTGFHIQGIFTYLYLFMLNTKVELLTLQLADCFPYPQMRNVNWSLKYGGVPPAHI